MKNPHVYPVGTAKRIPAGSTLLFSQHYTANGRGSDRTKIGFIFSKEPPQREIAPARSSTRSSSSRRGQRRPGRIGRRCWKMRRCGRCTHMHLRGKDMTYSVIYPDGRTGSRIEGAAPLSRLADRLLPEKSRSCCRKARRSTSRRTSIIHRGTNYDPDPKETIGGVNRAGKR